MSKLKITDVQVDCRELSQEQIDKLCEILERNSYTKSYICPSPKPGLTYLSIDQLTNNPIYGFYLNDNNCITITYDEFINLFDKPKFKPKKAIKELEQRITLLEQKLSEKEVVIEADVKFGVGDKLKEFETNNVFEVTRITKDKVCVKTMSDETITFPIPTIIYSLRNKYWIPLPPTNEVESKSSKEDENELVEGCVAKFWDDDEDREFEVGIYDRYTSSVFPHRSKKSDILYKNARRLSKEEVIDLLFTN